MERTLILIKPDAMQRGLAGEILTRFERRGLRIVAMKLMQVTEDLARQHYAEHEGKSFFPGLVSFITSKPLIAMVLEGPNAIALCRQTIGKTNPLDAETGSIRGDLAVDKGRNLVHGSDKAESATREIALWFGEEGIVEHTRDVDRWIIE